MRHALILLVRGYQRWLSPLKPPTCRFYPTCSSYAIQALREHGVIGGICLTAWRLLRCQPLCRGGEDQVPAARRSPTTSLPTAHAEGTDRARP